MIQFIHCHSGGCCATSRPPHGVLQQRPRAQHAPGRPLARCCARAFRTPPPPTASLGRNLMPLDSNTTYPNTSPNTSPPTFVHHPGSKPRRSPPRSPLKLCMHARTYAAGMQACVRARMHAHRHHVVLQLNQGTFSSTTKHLPASLPAASSTYHDSGRATDHHSSSHLVLATPRCPAAFPP